MLPTFSVNPNSYKNMAKVAKLVESPKYARNSEWLGEAYLRIVTGQAPQDDINLTAYSKVCERNSMLSRANKGESSLITQEEIAQGYKGVVDIVAEYVEDSLENVIDEIDEKNYVDSFLKARENVYYTAGKDIWRLIELAKLDDAKAQRKLREIMKEYELKELLEYVLTRHTCYQRIEAILG